MNTAPSTSPFLIILHQPAGAPPPPAELKKIMARFQTWMDGLRARHTVLSSNGLGPTGVVMRGPGGLSMTDGPYPEGKEVVGGYVLLETETMEQAVAAGRGCPGLDYNMAVEVRPVMARP
jgi:hypothetical protein